MLRRFFKLIAGLLLTLVGIAIVIEAIRFNVTGTVSRRDGWDPVSEFLLCVGVVVGGMGAQMVYSEWNPETAATFGAENSRISPSPGTPREGGGEGRVSDTDGKSKTETPKDLHPHPSTPRSPRQQEYRARESEQQTSPPDIGVQS